MGDNVFNTNGLKIVRVRSHLNGNPQTYWYNTFHFNAEVASTPEDTREDFESLIASFVQQLRPMCYSSSIYRWAQIANHQNNIGNVEWDDSAIIFFGAGFNGTRIVATPELIAPLQVCVRWFKNGFLGRTGMQWFRNWIKGSDLGSAQGQKEFDLEATEYSRQVAHVATFDTWRAANFQAPERTYSGGNGSLWRWVIPRYSHGELVDMTDVVNVNYGGVAIRQIENAYYNRTGGQQDVTFAEKKAK
jgi:hypothetical protein